MLEQLLFRRATINDVPSVVGLLFDDILGKTRENLEEMDQYTAQFNKIFNSDNQQSMVIEFENNVIACCELSILYSLTLNCNTRLLVEGVRVSHKLRGQGIGKWLFNEIEKFARLNGCSLIQLTTNKQRHDAHRFYDNLGYVNSHEGYKLIL